MFKAIVFVGLIAAANSALLPSRGLSLPRQQYYQPAHVNYQPRNVGPEAQAQILRSDSVVNPESFQYAYDTSNGISGQEAGQLKQIGQGAAIVSQGQFSYTSPEGQPIQLSYVADENGFQPSGAHLPVGPPIPPAIARAVEYLLRVNPQQQQPQQQYYKRF